MPSSFAFVDNFAIDGRSRRQIRSHVMRGKNTAQARISKRRHVPVSITGSGINEIPAAKSEKSEEDEPPEMRPLELVLHNSKGSLTTTSWVAQPFRRLEDTFSGIAFPVAVDDRKKLLIKHFFMSYGRYIYPPEFCYRQDYIETPWFNYSLVDTAYCYGLLAVSTASWDLARGRKKLSPEYKMYLSKCLSLLTEKLSDGRAREASTIALVIGLCILSMTLGDHSLLKIHAEGLRNVIRHRGGISTLAVDEPLIMEKALRADIEDALSSGCPATFSADVASGSPLITIPSLPLPEFPSIDTLWGIHPQLAQAAQEVHLLTQYLSSVATAQEGQKLRPVSFAYHVTYTFSKVLVLGSIGTSAFTNKVADIVHLTLCAILSVLTVQFGMPNERRYDILLARLTPAVDSFMAAGASLHTVIDPFLMNWILHILPATILSETESHWVIPKMVFVRDLLGFETWQEAHAAAQAYPWVTEFHDKHIRTLWSSQGSRQPLEGGFPSSGTPNPRHYGVQWPQA